MTRFFVDGNSHGFGDYSIEKGIWDTEDDIILEKVVCRHKEVSRYINESVSSREGGKPGPIVPFCQYTGDAC